MMFLVSFVRSLKSLPIVIERWRIGKQRTGLALTKKPIQSKKVLIRVADSIFEELLSEQISHCILLTNLILITPK